MYRCSQTRRRTNKSPPFFFALQILRCSQLRACTRHIIKGGSYQREMIDALEHFANPDVVWPNGMLATHALSYVSKLARRRHKLAYNVGLYEVLLMNVERCATLLTLPLKGYFLMRTVHTLNTG